MALQALTGIDLNNQRGVNAADPTAATDLVTKQYMDARISGLSWKTAVRAATTTNGALASAYANGSVIDGVTLATGDRILIKDQTAQSENGIYAVNSSGAPTRATDAATSVQLDSAAVFVEAGTVNADNAFTQTTNTPTVGTSNLVWAQFGGANLPNAGNGLTRTGNTIDVGAGTGISVAADTVGIDTSVTARHVAASVGNGSSTSIAVTHNLGTKDIVVSVRRTVDDVAVITDWTATDVNTVTLTFATAPSSNQYRVTVVG